MSAQYTPARTARVLTHRDPVRTAAHLRTVRELAAEFGVELFFDSKEVLKHGLRSEPGTQVDIAEDVEVDFYLVLGGDGTILHALRLSAGLKKPVPVFSVNLGQIGFLATVDLPEAEVGIRKAFAGEYDLLELPALVARLPGGSEEIAINDVSVNRQSGARVADLQYAINGEEVGRVRSDGIVIATPAGSTGYNLANGGPVLAWGVKGFAVSFIAPHTLSARALVGAPDDTVTIHNLSVDPVEIAVDGRPMGELAAGTELAIYFKQNVGLLAQTPGSSFYRRLREKFGKLAG